MRPASVLASVFVVVHVLALVGWVFGEQAPRRTSGVEPSLVERNVTWRAFARTYMGLTRTEQRWDQLAPEVPTARGFPIWWGIESFDERGHARLAPTPLVVEPHYEDHFRWGHTEACVWSAPRSGRDERVLDRVVRQRVGARYVGGRLSCSTDPIRAPQAANRPRPGRHLVWESRP